jgi:hypothetical protein
LASVRRWVAAAAPARNSTPGHIRRRSSRPQSVHIISVVLSSRLTGGGDNGDCYNLLMPRPLTIPRLFEPQQSVWTSQRQGWDLIDETLPAR